MRSNGAARYPLEAEIGLRGDQGKAMIGMSIKSNYSHFPTVIMGFDRFGRIAARVEQAASIIAEAAIFRAGV